MRVYISADYDEYSGDREVVDKLNEWSADKLHKIEFTDTAKVSSGSVSRDPDCRSCDLKMEFNRQINAASYVIIIIGDKTAQREAGSGCERSEKQWYLCECTPYKQNTNGKKRCKAQYTVSSGENVGSINTYSYIRHEFEQAKKRNKKIIVIYNSFYRQPGWLPSYMSEYEDVAMPFWIWNERGFKDGNYQLIKEALGYV